MGHPKTTKPRAMTLIIFALKTPIEESDENRWGTSRAGIDQVVLSLNL